MNPAKRRKAENLETEPPSKRVKSNSGSIPVHGEVLISDIHNPVQKKKGKPRLHHSAWFITVNTNQRHNEGSEELDISCQQLKEAGDAMLEALKHPNCPFVTVLDPDGAYSPEFIKNVSARCAFAERGPRYDQPHSHMILKIDHRTKLHLDWKRLQAHYASYIGSNPYIKGIAVPAADALNKLEHYVMKNAKRNIVT